MRKGSSSRKRKSHQAVPGQTSLLCFFPKNKENQLRTEGQQQHETVSLLMDDKDSEHVSLPRPVLHFHHGRFEPGCFQGESPLAIALPCWLVGRNFRTDAELFKDKRSRMEALEVRRDLENRHDRNAIGVYNYRNELVGYIEAVTARVVSPAWDGGWFKDIIGQVHRVHGLDDIKLPMFLLIKLDRNNPKATQTSQPQDQYGGFMSASTFQRQTWNSSFVSRRGKLDAHMEKLDDLVRERKEELYFQDEMDKMQKHKEREEMRKQKEEKEIKKKKQRLRWQQRTLDRPASKIQSNQKDDSMLARDWSELGYDLLRMCFSSGVLDIVEIVGRLRCVCVSWRNAIDENDSCWIRYQILYAQRIRSRLVLRTDHLCLNTLSLQAHERFGNWITEAFVDALNLQDLGQKRNACERLLAVLLFGRPIERDRLISMLLPFRYEQRCEAILNVPRSERLEFLHFVLYSLHGQRRHCWQSLQSRIEQLVLLRNTSPLQLVHSDEMIRQQGYLQRQRRKLTGEQLAICRTNLGETDLLKVVAMAGTGKTTTLVEYALARPHLQILYLAFNVSVREEARTIFPPNVTCTNMHKLAYSKRGFAYRSKLSPSLDVLKTLRFLKSDDCHLPLAAKSCLNYVSTRITIAALEAFLCSADDTIDATKHCLPVLTRERERVQAQEAGFLLTETTTRRTPKLPTGFDNAILYQSCCILWQTMKSVSDTNVPMTHSGYLKLYQLSKPKLYVKYDIIMLDEAQDSNRCVQDIVSSQKCARIVVGDNHQAIYGFLGANDALSNGGVSHTHSLTLSRSFRFGPNIAAAANMILRHMKSAQLPLLGARMDSDDVVNTLHFNHWRSAHRNRDVEDHEGTTMMFQLAERVRRVEKNKAFGKLCYLGRTNVQLWVAAQHVLHAHSSSTISFVGGLKSSGMDMLQECAWLCFGDMGKVTSPLLRSMGSFEKFENYVNSAGTSEWAPWVEIVNRFGAQGTLDVCRTVKQAHRDASNQATVILSTVHRAKGLEFDTVFIGDDFLQLPSDILAHKPEFERALSMEGVFGSSLPAMEQEINALYVAVTRAKREVFLNRTLTLLNAYTNALHTYSFEARKAEVHTKDLCARCGGNLIDCQGLLEEHQFGLDHANTVDFCSKCSREVLGTEITLFPFGKDEEQ